MSWINAPNFHFGISLLTSKQLLSFSFGLSFSASLCPNSTVTKTISHHLNKDYVLQYIVDREVQKVITEDYLQFDQNYV